MKIALFTNGQKAIIGNDEGIVSAFDPIILFQNPDLFGPRFSLQAKRRLDIEDFSEVDQLTIGLSGIMDQENNTILKSYMLNDLSRIKIYDGFNINVALKDIIDKDKILLANDAFVTGLGVQQIVKPLKLPCMILTIDKGVGVSYINESNNILSVEWGGDFLPSIGKSIYEMLTTSNIYNILFENAIDFNTIYTYGVIHAINHLEHKYGLNNPTIKSVVILGEKIEYLNVPYLLNAEDHKHLDITLISDENKANEVIMSGCLAYPDYAKLLTNKVTKIQYFAGEKMIHNFADFEKCISHFRSARPLSNLDNYYNVHRFDGSVETISMRDMEDVAALEKYRF